ncbi:MAG: hypothetical protein QXR39_08695 [Candidatus Methanomethylicia archaeon]
MIYEVGIVCVRHCNVGCPFCYSNSRVISEFGRDFLLLFALVWKDRKNYLHDLSERVCSIFKGASFLNIGITGGEPSLIPYWVYDIILNSFRKLNCFLRFTFSTNGSCLNNEYLEWLRHNNFVVSLSYDAILCRLEIRDFVFRLEEMAKVVNPDNLRLHFLVYKKTNIERIVKILRILDWLKCSFSLYIPVGRSKDYLLDEDSILSFFRRIFDEGLYSRFPEIVNMVNTLKTSPNILTSNINGIWGQCWNAFRIDFEKAEITDGDGCISRRVSIYEVSSVEDLFLKLGICEIIKKKLNPECEKCSYFSFCRGGCFLLKNKYSCTGLRKVLDFLAKTVL